MSEQSGSFPRLHETWTSRTTFMLAAIGSAIGLANVWKFPYIAGINGGGAFVPIYIFCIAVFIVPILMAEIAIGRHAGQSPVNAMRGVAVNDGLTPKWSLQGWLALAIGLIGLSYYSVVAGWTFAYMIDGVRGVFTGFDGEASLSHFNTLLSNVPLLLLWHALFMGITIFIVARGIREGIERAISWLMPILFVLLIILLGYSLIEGETKAGLAFLFAPKWDAVTPQVVLAAMGQAFFTVGVGVGSMMAYGAYLDKSVSIARSVGIIATADTLVALIAGMIVFPLVFSEPSLSPGDGPGLIFVTLPVAFGQMPLGEIFGALFFVLLAIAALTSSIALLEPTVAWLEEHQGFKRRNMAIYAGIGCWLFGLLSLFSFNYWSDFTPLGMFATFEGATLFDLLDYVLANVLLPVSGLAVAIFAGWRLSDETTRAALDIQSQAGYRIWRFLLRYCAPVGVITVFVYKLFFE